MIKYSKIFCLILSFIYSISISYAEKLPFIGKISYSASGGSAYVEIFEIKEDGNMTITGCGTTSCGLIYKGKYKSLLLPWYGNTKSDIFYKVREFLYAIGV